MIACAAVLGAGCRHVKLAGDGGVDGGDNGTDAVDYDAVDMLLVVDDSGSMGEEQQILATSLFVLLNGLVDPLPDSAHPALDDLRVAVVSTDMGLQWGGNAFDPDDDGWPYDPPPCGSLGKDGEFQVYLPGKQIDLEHGVIPCHESGSQCPGGWSCEPEGSDGIGVCAAPGENGDDQFCPNPPPSYAQTGSSAPNSALAFQVACMTNLGTSGCGFEQQLEASRRALERTEQLGFTRDTALLAVMFVSDEEDCSIEDGPSLFASEEIQDVAADLINVACGENAQFLYDAASYRDSYVEVKDGDAQAVLFAAIVGVPIDPACEGRGDQIDGCLDHPDMQLEIVQEGYGQWYYDPACIRHEDEAEVTKARPGRRFVTLAQELGESGYVYSICNEDWSPAMEDFAGLIFSRLIQD
jgi:hypothetical protein